MNAKLLLSAALLLTSPLVAMAQYTPGSGGVYVGPSGPTPPQPPAPPVMPGQPTYSWETPPTQQPQPQQIIQAPAAQPSYQIVQPPPQVVVPRLSDSQVADLTASVALYPDPILAEMLPATTYVEELAFADKWLAQHPGADERMIASLPVDDSVKSMMHYPSVLSMMTDHLDWTQALGVAFVYQRQDVMDSVQRWRTTAVDCGYLYSSPQQEVLRQGAIVLIQPAPRTQVVYVPVYDPAVVYVRARPTAQPPRNVITFATGGFSLSFIDNDVDWHDHEVRVPRHDDHDHGPGSGGHDPQPRGGAGGPPPGPPTKTVFVRDTLKPTVMYPEKILTPQPDHKVITMPPNGRGSNGDAATTRGRGN